MVPDAEPALDLHGAVRLPRHAVNLAEAETRALAGLFRREERFDGRAQHLLGSCRCRCPARKCGCSPGRRSRSGYRRRRRAGCCVSIDSVPPSGIASRELIARLRIAISICVGSTSAGHRPGARSVRTWIVVPMVRVSISRMPATTAFRSIGARLQVLAAREGEQLLGQLGAVLGGALRRRQMPRRHRIAGERALPAIRDCR